MSEKKYSRINLNRMRKMTVPVSTDSFAKVQPYIEKRLRRSGISDFIITETMLVFEALLHNMIEQGFGGETMLDIFLRQSAGEIYIKMQFDGKPFVPVSGSGEGLSPEDRILNAYNDKVDCLYHMGYNSIRITVRRSYRNSLILGLGGIVLALGVFVLLNLFTGDETQFTVQNRVLLPLIKLFSNAMLMVGTPVTFFSLLKNLTDTYIVAERNSGQRTLQAKTLITSVIATFLAIVMSLALVLLIRQVTGAISGNTTLAGSLSFADLMSALVPSSIIQPFEDIAPFPLIFVALLVTYAFCSAGKYFDKMKKAIDACYLLFSKMLNIVMFTLPLFCFFSILYLVLNNEFVENMVYLGTIVLIAVSLIVMALFYLIRLLVGGVKIGPFLKHLPILIRENLRINSAIDAVPFNVRYCAKYYGMDRNSLWGQLSNLAQINLDGNCYLIMISALMFISFLGISVSWFNIFVIAVLVIFLSFGSPNQPGSILIGLLIISMYLGEEEMVPAVIVMEVIFGPVQNIINVLGDIVTVAISEQKAGRPISAGRA